MGSSNLPQISRMNMKKSVGVATTNKLTLCTLSLGIHSPKLTVEHGTYVRFGVSEWKTTPQSLTRFSGSDPLGFPDWRQRTNQLEEKISRIH